jgi:ribonuclease D
MNQKISKIKPTVFQADIDESTFHLYSQDDTLAIDCEMMGLNPRRDRLCVIQITDSHNNFSLVQILPDQKSSSRIKALFENPDINKIFHYARMDTCFLKAHLGIETKNIFCTKIASKLARTYTDKHGLKELIREFFSENIDKKNQSSDWGKKILVKEQIDYACEDVRYLISLRIILEEMLSREHRLELAQRCFEVISLFNDLDYKELIGIFEH